MTQTTINERLAEIAKNYGLSIRGFEKQIGVSNGFVKNASKGIGADKMQSILRAYPDINEQWLLTGEGEMLKSGAVVGGNGIAVSGNNVKTGSVSVVGGEAAALREKVKMMQALLEEKDKLLEEKERNIADKERMIKILMER